MARGKNTEMPNLFVIGAQKCGTTSLHHYLGLHPEISMSKVKDPRYFVRPASITDLDVITDRDRYLSLFEPGARVRGDTSTLYSVFPRIGGVPAGIASETIDARFIYLVRDPLERIVSSLQMGIAQGRFSFPDQESGIRELPNDDQVNRGLYMTQIDQYLEFFLPEAILVLESERLRGDRRSAMAEVFEFLGVDSEFEHPGLSHVHYAGASLGTTPKAWTRFRATRLGERMAEVIPARRRADLKKKATGRFGKRVERPVLTPELTAELEEIFRPEVERLRAFTGQDFSGWSV